MMIINANDVKVVSLGGDIDGANAEEAQEQLGQILRSGGKILLDMRRVDYLSSAGLRVLLSVYRQLTPSGGSLGLVGLSEEIVQTLETSGLKRFFHIYEDVDAGLAALG
jgi:anti-sigma B factor antagonist